MDEQRAFPVDSASIKELPVRERVGLAIFGPDASAVVELIVAAEQQGLRQVWMTQGTPAPDTLTIFAVAASRTQSVRLGTAIVPTYPRHPLALAQQALTLNDLAPGRLRLGVGPSHRPLIEGVYGIPMQKPLEHLREYVTVLRGLLDAGKIEFAGHYYHVKSTLPRAPHTPILISTLREGAYGLAGEIADGAISWMSPVSFLLEKALPALQAGAARQGRPVPPLVAHVPVALSSDRAAVREATRTQVGRYGSMPFYANMFADAGFPIEVGGRLSDALIEDLVVSGEEAKVQERLLSLLQQGIDELLIMPIGVTDPQAEQKRLAQLLGQL